MKWQFSPKSYLCKMDKLYKICKLSCPILCVLLVNVPVFLTAENIHIPPIDSAVISQFNKARELFLASNDTTQAFQQIDRALATQNTNSHTYIQGHYLKSVMSHHLQDNRKALFHGLLANNAIANQAHSHAYNAINIHLGSIYSAMESYELALNYFQKSYKWLTQYDSINSTLYATTINSMASIYQKTGHIQKAIDLIRESIAIFENENAQEHLVKVYYNLTNLYIHAHKIDSANQCIEVFDSLYTNYQTSQLLPIEPIKVKILHISHQILNSRYNVALLQIDSIVDQSKYVILQAEYKIELSIYGIVAATHALQKKLGEKYKDSTLKYIHQFKHLRPRVAAYENIVGYYKYTQNIDSLVKYHDSLRHYDIQLNKINFQNALYDSQVKLEVFKNENKIRELESKKAHQKMILLLTIVGLICTLLFVLILIMRVKILQKKKKLSGIIIKKQEDLLLAKNQELISISINEVDINRIYQALQTEIETIKTKLPPKQIPIIYPLENTLTKNMNLQDPWKAFNTKFLALYPKFFEILEKNNEKLTINEKRLLAYIKLELTTKEISRILDIKTGSVRQSKMRLKKKLGLDDKTQLVEYIKSI